MRRFLALPTNQQRLVLSATGYLVLARLALWLLPFRLVYRLPGYAGRMRCDRAEDDQEAIAHMAWAVRAVSPYLPGTTCLVQALAVQTWLLRWGYPAQLVLGAAKDQGGRLQAHAWVESQGRTVIGGDSFQRFTPFPPLRATKW